MRNLVLLRALVLTALAAIPISCTPDIPQTPQRNAVIALFDPSAAPPIVPTPTDLVYDFTRGRLNIPIDPNASDAEKEFLSYLNSLDGYPADTPGRVRFSGPALDPATVTAANVRVMDVLANFAPVTGTRAFYDPASSSMTIAPPPTGWPIGTAAARKMYAVALIGGAGGLKGANGEPVVGSSVWALARLNTPLVTCMTQADGSTSCRATTDIIPSEMHDPQARLDDQAAKARQLEQLRLLYKPVLDSLVNQGVNREDVALVWTFSVSVRPVVTFDPANNIIPFPNNAVLSPTTGLVNLPIPAGASPLQQQLYGGLNTLDGFSTTAAIVSQNSDSLGALMQGKIDPATLPTSTGFTRLPGGTPGHPPTAVSVRVCLDRDCRTCDDFACPPSLLPDGGTPPDKPQQLQFVPNVPLDERSSYGAFISANLKDTNGQNVIPSTTFALARLANPLSSGGKSTVSVLSDTQALQLEALRSGLKPFIDGLGAQLQLRRENIALAWAFTTQSEVSVLRQLQPIPNSLPPPTALPYFVANITGTPPPNVRYVFMGEIATPVLLTGPGGTLNPAAPVLRKILVTITIPPGSPPTPAGFPVTIFGHGLTRARTDMMAIASRLALGGQVTIATDVIWHGDRSSCIGSRIFLRSFLTNPTDDDACAPLATTPSQCDQTTGRCVIRDRNNANLALCTFGMPDADLACVSQGQGACLSDNKCEGGDFARDRSPPVPNISGWNLLDLTNLFATRDNFRQQVIDLAQLTRVIQTSGPGSLNDLLAAQTTPPIPQLNGGNINYAGQSLGGILGTLYTSVAPEVQRVVLNVPGGDPANILLTSPAFALQKAGLIATLASQGIRQGTPAFDFFIGIAKWILDPADPQNMSFSIKNGTGVPRNRPALIQYINTDLVIPNPTTEQLIRAANRPTLLPPPTANLDPPVVLNPSFAALAPIDRHGFLLNFRDTTTSTTQIAQCQVTNFVNTGSIGTCP